MNVTFLAFVRHEEHLLLLKRLASDADFPALWDGVYGSGEDDAAVLDAVVTATGISAWRTWPSCDTATPWASTSEGDSTM